MNKKTWDTIRARSKITLKEDTAFKGLCKEDKPTILKRGTYYISGFWANMCGLSDTLEKARENINDYGIFSIDLKKFEEVED